MIGCLDCSGPPLCDRCVDAAVGHLGGTAGARGIGWAMAVAKVLPSSSRPWPAYEGKAAAIARRKVAGLSRDERVLEALAVTCHAEAARWWSRRER